MQHFFFSQSLQQPVTAQDQQQRTDPLLFSRLVCFRSLELRVTILKRNDCLIVQGSSHKNCGK